MTLKLHLLAALTGISLLTLPANAGGPVLIEDAAEAAPLVRSHNNRLVPILFGLAVAAILLGGGGGSDCACNSPDDGGGSCGC